MAEVLSGKRLQILNVIADSQRDRGYPPSVREIGEAVGLASSATVHTHLAVLQREGYLTRDPSKPRAIQVHFDPDTESKLPAAAVHNVPLVGDVAAGTGVLAEENIEELLPMPAQFTGNAPSFMLRVRGDSMVDAGILDGDYVVVRQQPDAEQRRRRRGRHRRERGDRQDIQPQGRQGRTDARQRVLRADDLRRVLGGRDDLRQGRHSGALAQLRRPNRHRSFGCIGRSPQHPGPFVEPKLDFGGLGGVRAPTNLYFRRRERRRSASFLPPVWQVGQ